MPYTIDELIKKVDDQISELEIAGDPKELYLPVEYCLKNGGKRVRPLLTLIACDMFGGSVSKAMPLAVGLEIFHNFTLMHDDIMDQAPIRRGKPAVHKKWDTNTAILSGDVMFALAYQYMLKSPEKSLKQILEVFNETVMQVCEGQQYDMNFETIDNVTEAEYLNMIRLKTAVLPASCLKIGAIVAEAPENEIQNLYLFGELFGLGFQLKDDWLDVFGDEEVFGKKTGGDIVANKKTWLYIKAFELADSKQNKKLKEAFSNQIHHPEEKINTVKNIYLQLGLNDLAVEHMEKYYKRAFDYLEKIKMPEESKSNLAYLINKLIERKS